MKPDRIRAAILVAFALIALPYAVATPIFEKNDEVWHFAFVRHLARGGDLPVQRPNIETAWLQIGSQPPLYYVLASLIVRAFDTNDNYFDAQRQPNQSPQYNPYWPGNKNMLLITPHKRPFGYRDSTLAALALRLLGILPGLVTVWFAWAIANAVSNKRNGTIVTTCLTAFNPMFLTVTTAVSNDGLVIALSTVAVYSLVKWTMEGATWRRALLTGIVIALATLAKVSGAVLLPIALLVVIAEPFVQNNKNSSSAPLHLRAPALKLLCLLAPFALIAGWWFVRNMALYGDPTGTNMMAAVAGTRNLSVLQAMGEFEGFRLSYLAMFGQFNVPVDDIAYKAWDVLLVVGVIGFATHIVLGWKRESPAHWRAVAVMALHILLTLVAIVRWTMMTPASHGRLLFPAIAGVSVLMAIGLSELVNSNWVRGHSTTQLVTYLPTTLLTTLAVISPFRYVFPAYTPPLVTAMPAGFISIQQTLTPWAEVLGYSMEPRDARPGDKVRVNVFMRAIKAPRFNWSLVTNLYGRDNTPLGRFDTFTGGGLLPSSEWRPGQTWVDTVQFTVPQSAITPAILRAQFGLYNAGSGEIAPSRDANGNEAAPLYDGSTVLPTASSNPTAPIAHFGNVAQLNQSFTQPHTGSLSVRLRWQTLQRTPTDYAVFVHIFDAAGKRIAQQDSQPLGGQFPTTRWQAGVAFDETRTITLPESLPSGTYTVLIGLYDSQSGARLEAQDANGNRAKDDALKLGEFTVR